MAEKSEKPAKLPAKQSRAVVALLSHRTQAEAANAAGIGERTLATWLTQPEFQAALRAAEGDAIDAAVRDLICLQGDALNVLAGLLTDNLVKGSVRLRAAQVTLDNLMKLRELRNVESRLARLEELMEREVDERNQ